MRLADSIQSRLSSIRIMIRSRNSSVAHAGLGDGYSLSKQRCLPRSAQFAVWTVFLGALFRELANSTVLIELGGFNIQVFELGILATLIAIAFLAQRFKPSLRLPGLLALGLAGLLFLHILRGFALGPTNGIEALRASGPVAAILVLGIYLAAAKCSFGKIRSAIEIIASLAALLALGRLLGGVPIYEDFASGRPATSGGAMLIGAGLIFAVVNWRPTAAPGLLWRTAKVGFLGLALLVSQQATAIVATLIAIVVLLALYWTRSRRWSIASLAGLLCIILPTFLLRDWIISLLPEWIIGSRYERNSNLEWRQEIWQQVLNDFERWSVIDKLAGLPGGVVPTVQLNNFTFWEHSLHSQYIGTLSAAGALGLFLYIALLLVIIFLCIRALLTSGPPMQTEISLAIAFCTQLAVFGYSYELRPEHGLILMIALVVGSRCSRELAVSRDRQLASAQFRVNRFPASP